MDAMQLVYTIGGVGGALGALVTIWNLLQGPTRGLAEKLAKLDAAIASVDAATDVAFKSTTKEVDDAKGRISTVETVLKSMPDKDSVHRLELALERINTRIAGMAGSAEATERTARRVEQFLLDQAKVPPQPEKP